MRTRFVLLLAVALVSVPPAALAHGTPASTGSGSLGGAGWVRAGFTDDDGHLHVTVQAKSGQLPMALGVDLVDDDGRPLFLGGLFVERLEDGRRVEVGSGDLEVVDIDEKPGGVLSVTATFEVRFPAFGPLDGHLALWSAGPVTSTSWSIDGGSGSSLGEVLQGPETFLFLDDDLEGPVEAESPALGVRGQVAAGQSISIDRTFVGAFAHGANSTDDMDADTPTDSRSCPCAFSSLSQHAPGPGEYSFEATGVGYGQDRWILLTGADVPRVAG